MAAAMLMAAVASSAVAQTPVAQPVEVELHVHRGRLFVPVESDDGTAMEFLLGTGWPTGLTASTAARLGEQPELTLGGMAIPPDDLSTYPDSMLTIDGTTLAGVLGPNTLSRFDVLIDVPGGRLVLKPIGRVVEWEGMTLSDPIDLRIMHGVEVWLSVELAGNEYQAILDLEWKANITKMQLKLVPVLPAFRAKVINALRRVGDYWLAGLNLAIQQPQRVEL